MALLDHRSDIDRPTADTGRTPLSMAAELGSVSVMRVLLDRGSDMTARARAGGGSVMHWAVLLDTWKLTRSAPVVKLLLERGVDMGLLDDAGETPLHWTVRSKCHDPWDSSEVVRMLVRSGVEMNKVNREGLTALRVAINFKQRGGILRELFEHGGRE